MDDLEISPAEVKQRLDRWVLGVSSRREYMNLLGECRVESLGVREHAYSAPADFGY